MQSTFTGHNEPLFPRFPVDQRSFLSSNTAEAGDVFNLQQSASSTTATTTAQRPDFYTNTNIPRERWHSWERDEGTAHTSNRRLYDFAKHGSLCPP